MSLSAPRVIFGVHSVTPYVPSTGIFYGELRVLDGSSLSMQGEHIELFGGSSKFSWATEDGTIKAEMSLKASEYPDFLFTLFLGKAPTANSAETGGAVAVAAANKKGSSVVAATGITAVTVKSGSETDLKAGLYLLKATDATHLDVYYASDIDISRGTDGTMQNDLLKVTASPLVVTQSVATTITNFGLEFTGGAGTIALVAGDTAVFRVRPINTKSMKVVIGAAASQTFPEFGAIVMAQKQGNEEIFELDCYRCKGSGFPISFEKSAFSKADIKVKVLYDATKDGVFEVNTVSPS